MPSDEMVDEMNNRQDIFIGLLDEFARIIAEGTAQQYIKAREKLIEMFVEEQGY